MHAHILVAAAKQRLPLLFDEGADIKLRPGAGPSAPFDLRFDLKYEGSRRPLYVEVKSRLLRTHYEVFRRQARILKQRDPLAIALFVVPHLSERGRHELRAAKINHADFDGTIFIRTTGLVLDIKSEGKSPLFEVHPSSINPFSDKASLVLRVLCERANRKWRVTEIADSAAVTKGWVSVVTDELVRRGYVDRAADGIRLIDPVSMLQDWTASYSWKANRVESYSAGFRYEELLQLLPPLISRSRATSALTLLAASDLLARHVEHQQIHLYVAPEHFATVRRLTQAELFLVPSDNSGNFHLLNPRYPISAFFGRQVVGKLPVASALQVYLDLVHFPLRGREAAEILMRTLLGGRLGITAQQLGQFVV